MPWSSNATFLVSCCLDGQEEAAIYKPGRGERPLWDFPGGLYRREAAAYELSKQLGWDVVPETIVRGDGPLGPGSLQLFIEADFSHHYFTLLEMPEHNESLRRIACFDLLANNADRKSGHCLLGPDGRIWGIDNGLCFHEEPKVRTVIWDFAGEQIPPEWRREIDDFASEGPSEELWKLLRTEEAEALLERARRIADRGRFPKPRPDHRSYPWPLV